MLITKARMMTALAAILSLGSAQAAETSDQTVEDTIVVTGRYLSIDQLNAVKTPTPILNVPQSLSIVTRAQIEDQAFTSIGDILRYTPGLAVSQGEGHRDSIIIRGNQSTRLYIGHKIYEHAPSAGKRDVIEGEHPDLHAVDEDLTNALFLVQPLNGAIDCRYSSCDRMVHASP